MWKLKKISIRNIVSFREAELEIAQNVATLIFGKNEDNASQPCNGSGKSSLIEAISFALTGEQLRKVKSVEEIINDQANDASVHLVLTNDYDGTTFEIKRNIGRGVSQVVSCAKYDSEHNEIDKGKTIQPTVADYNKFILSEIGLTKDEIYNFFILCDNKFESFFDSSDKNKKETINRFSNGVLIDESIERLHKDMEPVEKDLVDAKSNLASVNGSLSAIVEELSHVQEKEEEAQKKREERIRQIDESIGSCRLQLDGVRDKRKTGENRLKQLHSIKFELSEMEQSDMSLVEAYNAVRTLFANGSLDEVSHFDSKLGALNKDLEYQMSTITSYRQKLNEIALESENLQVEIEEAKELLSVEVEKEKVLTDKDADAEKSLNKKIQALDRELDGIEADLTKKRARDSKLIVEMEQCQAKLNGVVKCPACGHQFLLNEDKSYDEMSAHLQSLSQEADSNSDEMTKLHVRYTELNDQAGDFEMEIDRIQCAARARQEAIDKKRGELNNLILKGEKIKMQMSELEGSISNVEIAVEKTKGKIDILKNRLFGEAYGIVDGRILSGQSFLERCDSDESYFNGRMEIYRKSRMELLEAPAADFKTSLTDSLEKYRAKREKASQLVYELQTRYDELKAQELNFTMFMSYIARKKIDALSSIVNDFLEKIGSDIRLRLEGYSTTKTGKVKDKISVQVTRDGIDCGSYQKFSGGEKARLNLACILSLHTLTNSNCEDGKGLDFIIIDELLDKSDEMGMSTYCEALNKLGQTALLITQGAVSETYPHKLLITKRQGVSEITY